MNSDTSSAEAVSGYETVFTVTDYYDGPRKGLANYQGKPHFYECVFDENRDEYSDQYRLTPVDEETFRLAMEDWEIWLKWETAFHAGKADINSIRPYRKIVQGMMNCGVFLIQQSSLIPIGLLFVLGNLIG